MWFRDELEQGICDSDEQRLEQLESVRSLQAVGGFQTEHEFMYSCLSILDDKASALLTFNSIILAAIAIFLTSAEGVLGPYLFLAAFLTTGASCCLCLQVVRLHWSDTPSLAASERLWLDLTRIRDRRTRFYRAAWLFAGAALLVLVIGAALDAVGL